MLRRLQEAWNVHNPDATAALFSADYRSVSPTHPNRAFTGNEQVLKNWASVFRGVPDFHAEVLTSITDGQAEWGECEWRGTHTDGSAFLMRGVIILTVQDELIGAARLYMEPVESDGGDIDTAAQDLYKPPPQT
jgi:SnoaL-like protein